MELTKKIQETIKKAIENEYAVNHSCIINNNSLHFNFEDGETLDIKIDIRIQMSVKESKVR